MQSLQILKDNKNSSGFTIVEILVVLGIFIAIISFSAVLDTANYSRELSRSEISILVSALTKARSQSMNNVGAVPHGVHIELDKIVIYPYPYNKNNSINESILRNPNIIINGATDVLFAQLSGSANADTVFILTDGANSSQVHVRLNGEIEW